MKNHAGPGLSNAQGSSDPDLRAEYQAPTLHLLGSAADITDSGTLGAQADGTNAVTATVPS